MLYRLTTKDGGVLSTIEVGIVNDKYVEVAPHVNIINYTAEFLRLKKLSEIDNAISFTQAIDEVSNLNKWMWEIYFARKKNTKRCFEPIARHIRIRLTEIAEEFDLKADLK